MGYNAKIAPFDLSDSYFAAFRAAVKQGGAAGVMCSYNAINKVPACANAKLTQLLRGTWGFDGYITSDSGAISNIAGAHRYAPSAAAGTADAINAGCDINSGHVYSQNVQRAVTSKLLNQSAVDAALSHAFRVRMRLGLFDPPGAYSRFEPDVVGSAPYHALSAQASHQGMTLLSNRPTTPHGATPVPALPLARGRRLAVIGPNAQTRTLMAGGTGGGLLSAQVVCKGAKSRTDW